MKKCPTCQTTLREEDKTFGYYYQCPSETCYFESYEPSKGCCNDPSPTPTKYYKDETDAHIYSDNFSIYRQCQTCGKKIGTALKKSDYTLSDLPLFDRELVEQSEEKGKVLNQELKEMEERKKANRRDKFWDDYEDYLKSDRWKKIRDIVLSRDNNLCQSCLIEPATQVHHTVGHFRKNEPIFSLVSVCNRCHDIITTIERGGHQTADKIQYSFDKDGNKANS